MTNTAYRTLLGVGPIILLAWTVAQAQTTVRMEAEDMQLDTYRIEVLDFASNGALINLKGEGFVGTATAPFPGVGGEYDISVVYHDENDGLAQLTVSINDREVDSWTLDERVKGGEQPIEANRFTREIATGYSVATGDKITINGLQGNWDHANVDYIEFVPADGEPTVVDVQELEGPSDWWIYRFGKSVAVDSDTAVVAASNSEDGPGRVYIFTRSGGVWTRQAMLGYYVSSVAIDGDTIVVGVRDSVHVLTRSGDDWIEEATLVALGDGFGSSVAIDGDTIVVGAPGYDVSGSVHIFTRSGDDWVEEATLVAGDVADEDGFGSTLAIDNDSVIIGSFGAAYVFTRSGGVWTEQARLLASDGAEDNNFGGSVAIDGDTAIVGASDADSGGSEANGAAYVFTRSSGVWREQAKLLASENTAEDGFGRSVAIDGRTTIIGAVSWSTEFYPQGEAYVFTRSGGIWTEQATLGRTVAGYGASFGASVALDGDTVVVGSPGSGEVGDNGRAYVFELGAVPTLRIEAEDMRLDGYRTESLPFASGGVLINLKGPAANGSATTAFSGTTGQYDIAVVYHDENDGVAQLSVSIAGVSVDSWILDERIKDGQQPEEFNRFTRQIATGYTVNSGDEIRIDGLQGNWDHANVDYIEFVLRQPPPFVNRIEAEDMLLDGYRVEALDFASGGALINLKGSDGNGSATLAFPGDTDQYRIVVVYHDENDGVAQLSVSIAGVSVDSWILDERIKDGQQPEEYNRFTREIATDYTVNSGDEIRIDGLRGNWDQANVDYIGFLAVP